nr:uncharacterized protein LOC103433516 isoform X2 [Malus domestica]
MLCEKVKEILMGESNAQFKGFGKGVLFNQANWVLLAIQCRKILHPSPTNLARCKRVVIGKSTMLSEDYAEFETLEREVGS